MTINKVTDSAARKAWRKPSVVAVTPLAQTRAGVIAQPTGEVNFYNPVS